MEEKEVNSDCCSGWLCSSRLNWMVRMRKQKAFQNLLFDLQVRLLLELLLTLLFLVYFGLLSIEQKSLYFSKTDYKTGSRFSGN